MSNEYLAQIAYEAYAACADKNPEFRGDRPVWKWQVLDASIREAWIAGVAAVLAAQAQEGDRNA